MKIINPSVEFMRTGLETDFMTPEQFIEKVGRTCYKSEDKITDDSAAKFVTNLIKRGHEAMIEHWNLIFKTDLNTYIQIRSDWSSLISYGEHTLKTRLRPFLRFTHTFDKNNHSRFIISGNMRAWRDFIKAHLEAYGYISNEYCGLIRCYPLFFPEYQEYVPAAIVNDKLIPISVNDLVGDMEKGVHWDVTVKFICDRGVSHEIVRHRTSSFAQESTRYCNYSGDKFGHEITVIRPAWAIDHDIDQLSKYSVWRSSCLDAEHGYFEMLGNGATPQEARAVLPNSTKTEVVMTTNMDGWVHFFDLRCDPAAHPDMQIVANMAKSEFDRFRSKKG